MNPERGPHHYLPAAIDANDSVPVGRPNRPVFKYCTVLLINSLVDKKLKTLCFGYRGFITSVLLRSTPI